MTSPEGPETPDVTPPSAWPTTRKPQRDGLIVALAWIFGGLVVVLGAAMAAGAIWLISQASRTIPVEIEAPPVEVVAPPREDLLLVIPPASDASGVRVVTNPAWITPPQPIFPDRAGAAGVEAGAVTLDCFTDSQGEVVSCAIVEETPPGVGFGEAAVLAAGRARVRPRTIDGQNMPAKIRFTVRFRLQ